MVKKIIIGLLAFLVLGFATLLAAPFLFKDKIQAFVLKSINNNLTADVNFTKVDLTLIKNFPKATVEIIELSVVNQAPFEGDTLFYSQNLQLKMSIKELFKKEDEVINIQSFTAKNSLVNILFNEEGIGNYDIAIKKDDDVTDDVSKDGLNFNVDSYQIDNMTFVFDNAQSKMRLVLDNINHKGTGDFSAKKLDLNTQTSADFGFNYGGNQLFNQVPISLDAVLGIDLENQKYSFKENKALIRKLILELDGFLQLNDKGQLYDLKFKTPTSSFQNFLALVPSAYTGNLNNVDTKGDFSVIGLVKGQLTENTIPTFDIKINSNNASFKFPDLPKRVDQIVINTHIANKTGLTKDTYVDLKQLKFKIDQDVFEGDAFIESLTTNANVKANAKGTLNLANLSQAYPLTLDKPLTGILRANISTAFDMASVEKEQYQNIKNSGDASLMNFSYTDDNGKTMAIKEAKVAFNPQVVRLDNFEAKTGASDIKASGNIDNFYGYLFNNQNLKGHFNLESNKIVVADFMTTASEGSSGKSQDASKEVMKIPAFLDCSISAKANTVVYDDLNLKNVEGNLIIKDETMALNNVSTDIFGGQIAFNGNVSTKATVPTFEMDMALKAVDVLQSFTQLETLKKILPIAQVINGKLNSNFKLNGQLNATELTPNLNTLSGDLFGQLFGASINKEKSKLLNTLDGQFNFLDVSKINLNDIKTALTFENGKVNVKPFSIRYQDINMMIGGTHGFDQQMNYKLDLQVPAKYLGTKVNSILNKLTPAQQNQITSIPISANIGGSFQDPKITTDLKQATNQLVKNIAEQQKNALIGKGTDALSGLIDKNKKPGDTTKTVIPTAKEELNTRIDDEKAKLEEKAREEKARLEEKAKQEANKKANKLLDGLLNKKKGN